MLETLRVSTLGASLLRLVLDELWRDQLDALLLCLLNGEVAGVGELGLRGHQVGHLT